MILPRQLHSLTDHRSPTLLTHHRDIVCIASAGYPCYRNILKALGCELLTVDINDEFKVTVKELKAAQEELLKTRGKKVRAIILSSPSNPTGAMLTPDELKGQ